MLNQFRQLVFAALCAGALAGVTMAVLHQVIAVPLIEQAGRSQPPDHDAHMESSAHGTASRTVLTLLTDVLVGVGFALLLSAGMKLRGEAPTLLGGALWGLAGFATFALAPLLGMPPALPGVEAAPLVEGQIWWLGTVVATGAGLSLLAFGRGILPALVGIVLIVAPHGIGAPQPSANGGATPTALSHLFALTSLVTLLLFWLVLGLACAWFLRRPRPDLTA